MERFFSASRITSLLELYAPALTRSRTISAKSRGGVTLSFPVFATVRASEPLPVGTARYANGSKPKI